MASHAPTTKDWTLFREADAEGHNSIHGKLDEMKTAVLTGHYGGLVEWIDQRGSDWEASPVNKNADPHSPDVLVESIKKHSHSISGWRPNIWVAPGAKISLIEEKIKDGFDVQYGKRDLDKKSKHLWRMNKSATRTPKKATDPEKLTGELKSYMEKVEQLKEQNKILRENIEKQQAKIKELETTIKTLQHGLDIKGLEKDIDPMMICPITHEIMRDPVSDNEGNNYEKSAITEWITRGNKNSPTTRQPLFLTDLIPNRELKDVIDNFLKDNPEHKLSGGSKKRKRKRKYRKRNKTMKKDKKK